MSGRFEDAARALKRVAEEFSRPVAYYVEGEARDRYEAANPGLDYYDTPPDPEYLRDWSILVIAVLEAIREPDDGIRSAMEKAASTCSHDFYYETAWRMGVDALLAQGRGK